MADWAEMQEPALSIRNRIIRRAVSDLLRQLDREDTDLIRDLVKHRIASDPVAADFGLTPDVVDGLSKTRPSMLPEAGIVVSFPVK
jgi:hypothetical protein